MHVYPPGLLRHTPFLHGYDSLYFASNLRSLHSSISEEFSNGVTYIKIYEEKDQNRELLQYIMHA